jgi:hypothetical protein
VPSARAPGGTSWVTTERTPTRAPSPTVTPRSGPDDGARADDDRRREQRLLAHGPLDVADVVVEVDEDDLVAQARGGADLDALVGRDDAALAQARLGADDHRGAGSEVQAAAIADAAAVAQREDRAGREVEAHAAPQPRPPAGREAAAVAQAGQGEAEHRRAA